MRFAGTALLFSAIVGVGTSLFLFLSSCFGYLPYSDRPGPGWWGRVHFPSWAEFTSYIGFAPFFAYFCLFFGVGIFGLSLVLGFASTPRWLNRLIGGILCAMAGGMAVLGAGWYLALAEIGPDSALVLGLIYGLFLFPRFIRARSKPVHMALRIGLGTITAALFIFWIISPFIPSKPVPPVNFDWVRITSGDQTFKPVQWLGPGVSNQVASLNLRGEIHGGIGGGASSGTGGPEIDAQLISLEPITRKSTLALPQSGYVVYVLKGGEWIAYPSFSKKDKRTVTVEPGTDPKFDGGQWRCGDDPKFSGFTWYPVIPKGR
jgi:hypothetical protein